MRWLELKIPPLIVGLLTGGAMWLLARCVPGAGFVLPGRDVIAVALGGTGVAVAVLAIVEFGRQRTTVHPLKPEGVRVLVVSGVFRQTRNPMYLGLLLTLVAWGAVLKNFAAFGLLPLFVLYLDRFQIGPEERALAERFGDEFAAYRRRVRRWL